MLRELRKICCDLENGVGYEAEEVCEDQIVKSYMGHVEEIELINLMNKSEPVAIFFNFLKFHFNSAK